MKTFTHVAHDYEFKKLKTINIKGKRYYNVDKNLHLPSITSITGSLPEKLKGLREWRERVGEKEASKITVQASRRGTKVHELIENYLNNDLDNKFVLGRDMFETMIPVLDNIDNIYEQEVPLWSCELGVAGRCDCIAEYDGVLSVIDFKTSRKPKQESWIKDYFLQACAYSKMWEERTGSSIDQLVILIAVDNAEPQVFISDANEWHDELKSIIYENKQRVQQGT